jgi:hypothetical protein
VLCCHQNLPLTGNHALLEHLHRCCLQQGLLLVDTQWDLDIHTAQLLAVHLALLLVEQHTCQGTSAVLQARAEAHKDSIVTRLQVGSRALHRGYCLEPLWCCQLLLRKGCCCPALA